MGSATSAVEKAATQSLLQRATKTDTKLLEGDLSALLSWCRRKGLLQSPEQLYDLLIWEKIRKELWEGVMEGNKEARKLALTRRMVKLMLEQMAGEVEISAAVTKAIKLLLAIRIPLQIL